jgi:hypothetical protein
LHGCEFCCLCLREEEIEDVGESEMENGIFYSRGGDKEVTGFHNDGSYVFSWAPGMGMMKKLCLSGCGMLCTWRIKEIHERF